MIYSHALIGRLEGLVALATRRRKVRCYSVTWSSPDELTMRHKVDEPRTPGAKVRFTTVERLFAGDFNW